MRIFALRSPGFFPFAAVLLQFLLGIESARLKVLTFNIWMGGSMVDDGLNKIAKHVKHVDADIVFLQEGMNSFNPSWMDELLSVMGPPWKGVYGRRRLLSNESHLLDLYAKANRELNQARGTLGELSEQLFYTQWSNDVSKAAWQLTALLQQKSLVYSGVVILTKHEFDHASRFDVHYAMGTTVVLNGTGQRVNAVGVHLNARSYGPYAANSKMVTTENQILQSEKANDTFGRQQNVEELLASRGFNSMLDESALVPLIVAGDFNSPSHEDWIEETKSFHGGWVFEWPATKMLADKGLKDTYRTLHPNVTTHPGITWSTVQRWNADEWKEIIPEPRDRIDYIFYRSPSDDQKNTTTLRAVECDIYSGQAEVQPKPNHRGNDYPSDHYAVYALFELLDSSV